MQKISILPNHSDNISLYAYVKQVEDFRVTSYHIKFLSCCELLNMIKKNWTNTLRIPPKFKNYPKVQNSPPLPSDRAQWAHWAHPGPGIDVASADPQSRCTLCALQCSQHCVTQCNYHSAKLSCNAPITSWLCSSHSPKIMQNYAVCNISYCYCVTSVIVKETKGWVWARSQISGCLAHLDLDKLTQACRASQIKQNYENNSRMLRQIFLYCMVLLSQVPQHPEWVGEPD